MNELLVTSSVLIVALLLLRLPFRRAISRRMQYALWLVVLVRLLLPVSFAGLSFSVLTLADHGQTQLSYRVAEAKVNNPVPTDETTTSTQENPTSTPTAPVLRDSQTFHAPSLVSIWLVGVGVCALCFLYVNLRLAQTLRRKRILVAETNTRLPVYLCEHLPSPCLFGLFRPAIYVNPAVLRSEASLRHVLAHESAHYRQGDHIWSALRACCLCVHWFNPLVWVAAWLSKLDCELACDELALQQLDETERLPYGETLLSLIPLRGHGTSPLLTATTMQGSKRQLRQRISHIANKQQPIALAVFVLLVLVAFLCVVTFTGNKNTWLKDYQLASISPNASAEHDIPLSEISPYEPPPTPQITEVREDEISERLAEQSQIIATPMGNCEVFLYRTKNRDIGAGYRFVDAPKERFYRFASFSAKTSVNLNVGTDIFSEQESSFYLSHWQETSFSSSRQDLYYFDKAGQLQMRLAAGDIRMGFHSNDTSSPPFHLSFEILPEPILWLEQSHELYRIDIRALVAQHYPDWIDLHIGTPCLPQRNDFLQAYYPISGYVKQETEHGDTQLVLRRCYLWMGPNGLRIDADQRNNIDHIASSVVAPKEILAHSQDLVAQRFREAQTNQPEMQYIDWRIEHIEESTNLMNNLQGYAIQTPPISVPVNYEHFQDRSEVFSRISIVRINYEYLSAAPEHFIPGLGYLTTDGWCNPDYPGSEYLVFLTTFDKVSMRTHYQYLGSALSADGTTESEAFISAIDQLLAQAFVEE